MSNGELNEAQSSVAAEAQSKGEALSASAKSALESVGQNIAASTNSAQIGSYVKSASPNILQLVNEGYKAVVAHQERTGIRHDTSAMPAPTGPALDE